MLQRGFMALFTWSTFRPLRCDTSLGTLANFGSWVPCSFLPPLLSSEGCRVLSTALRATSEPISVTPRASSTAFLVSFLAVPTARSAKSPTAVRRSPSCEPMPESFLLELSLSAPAAVGIKPQLNLEHAKCVGSTKGPDWCE